MSRDDVTTAEVRRLLEEAVRARLLDHATDLDGQIVTGLDGLPVYVARGEGGHVLLELVDDEEGP